MWAAGITREKIEALQKAVDLDPSRATAWANLGWAYSKLGKGQQADEVDQKLRDLRDDPDIASEIDGVPQGWESKALSMLEEYVFGIFQRWELAT